MKQIKNIESYKHAFAKEVLKAWFEKDYTCLMEHEFKIDGRVIFKPDLTLMINNRVVAIYEIVHRHGLNGKKLGRIQSWCYRNYDFPVYEINADYILNQVSTPPIVGYELLDADKYETDTSRGKMISERGSKTYYYGTPECCLPNAKI